MQRNYDKSVGFTAFPFTNGEHVEKARESATKKLKEEFVSHLEKTGAILSNTASKIA